MTDHESNTCVHPVGQEGGPAVMIPLALETYRKSMIDCDIYLRKGPGGELTLYREKSERLDSDDLHELAKKRISELYVSLADQEAYRRDMGFKIRQDTSLPPLERYDTLREISHGSFEAAFRTKDVEQIVTIVNDLGVQLAEVLSGNDILLRELLPLMDRDDDTYLRSVNVATYATLLAKCLGVSDDTHLRSIMIGGLFHDLGKCRVDRTILNKSGTLDRDELRQMEQHPTLGFMELLPRGELTWEQLMMVYQHHERYDGTGYPVGLPGSEIHDLARVTTVADVFRALMSVRAKGQLVPAEQVCFFLADQSGTMLDPEITRCWISKMKADVCTQQTPSPNCNAKSSCRSRCATSSRPPA